jgi:hypothetical protein
MYSSIRPVLLQYCIRIEYSMVLLRVLSTVQSTYFRNAREEAKEQRTVLNPFVAVASVVATSVILDSFISLSPVGNRPTTVLQVVLVATSSTSSIVDCSSPAHSSFAMIF